MGEVKHTPTPWGMWSEEGDTPTGRARFSVCHNDLPVTNGWCEVALDEGEHKCVLETYGDNEEQAKANAAFVVRAVNCHDDLVAALKQAEKFIANGIEFGFIRMPDPDTPDSAHKTLPTIRAALAKADAGTVRLGEIGE